MSWKITDARCEDDQCKTEIPEVTTGGFDRGRSGLRAGDVWEVKNCG